MASVFVLLEAFNRKEAAALGFFPCATASTLYKVKIKATFKIDLNVAFNMVRVAIQNFLKKPVISTVFKADE